MSVAADVGGVDRHHRVGDLPGGAGVLPADPGRGGAGLLLAGLVEDQPGVPVAQMPHGEGPHHVPRRPLIPFVLVEQALLAVRAGVTGPLRDAPAVLARQIGAQTADIGHRMGSGLPPAKQPGQLRLQLRARRDRRVQVHADR